MAVMSGVVISRPRSIVKSRSLIVSALFGALLTTYSKGWMNAVRSRQSRILHEDHAELRVQRKRYRRVHPQKSGR
jgi:hypothetical protein